MPHPTPLFPDVALFSRRVARRCRQDRKDAEKKQDIFCLLNTPRLEYGGHRPEREHKGLWLRSSRDSNVFGKLEGLSESFNFEGPVEEVFECSSDIADEKQCGLIARKTSC